MNTKKFMHRVFAVAICLCMVIAYTPTGAFAEVKDNSQDETSAQAEQTTQVEQTTQAEQTVQPAQPAQEQSQASENSGARKPAAADEQKPANLNEDGIQTENGDGTDGAAENAGDADDFDSSSQSDETFSEPETPADTELEPDETDGQSVSVPAEESMALAASAASELAHCLLYDDEEGGATVSEAEMPPIIYMIAVIFYGIKNAGLISNQYKITFDGTTYYEDGSYYSDTVSFTKPEASIDHDKHGNVILWWLFFGSGYDEEGRETYTVLDMDTVRQSHTHIPGYTLKSSKSGNIEFSLSLFWDDEEYDEYDPNQFLLIGGVSVTENKYEKAGATAAAMDASPATGDDQPMGLFVLLMCLSLMGILLIVLAGRRRHA